MWNNNNLYRVNLENSIITINGVWDKEICIENAKTTHAILCILH